MRSGAPSQATPEPVDLRRERASTMRAAAVALPALAALRLTTFFLLPPINGTADAGARMAFAVKCICLATLFCLVSGVEAVAHERLHSPAIDPLSGYATRRLRINQRYLQNTMEQLVVFGVGLAGLALTCTNGSAMRAVVATTLVWIVARFAFWIGYHRGSATRGYGTPSLALGMLVLLYDCGRFGYELGGPVGAALPIVLFAAVEVVLVRETRPDDAQPSRDAR